METIDVFNDKLGIAFVALSEQRFADTFHQLKEIKRQLKKAKHAINSQERLYKHSNRRNIKHPNDSATTSRSSTQNPMEDYSARVETIEAVEKKLKMSVEREIQTATHEQLNDVNRCKELWNVGSQLGSEQITEWFCNLATTQFQETAIHIVQRLEAVTSLQRMTKNDTRYTDASNASTPHSMSTSSIHKYDEEGDEAAWRTQPHVAAFVALLGAASTWVTQVMEEQAPHRARSIVVTAIHDECCKHAVNIIHLFEQAKNITWWREQLMQYDKASPRNLLSHSTMNTETHASGQSNTFCLQKEDWSVLDELLDQSSFVLQVAERYLRLVTVALALGVLTEGSKLRCNLTKRTQELMSEYVFLEQSSLRIQCLRALSETYEVEVDHTIVAYSWPDDLFFIVHKAISRAVATHSVLAAAACANNAVACLREHVESILNVLLHICTIRSNETESLPNFSQLFSIGDVQNNSTQQENVPFVSKSNLTQKENQDPEDALHAALQSLLIQSEHTSSGSQETQEETTTGTQTKNVSSFETTFEHNSHVSNKHRVPNMFTVCDASIWALNSIVMGYTFAQQLQDKFILETHAVFPISQSSLKHRDNIDATHASHRENIAAIHANHRDTMRATHASHRDNIDTNQMTSEIRPEFDHALSAIQEVATLHENSIRKAVSELVHVLFIPSSYTLAEAMGLFPYTSTNPNEVLEQTQDTVTDTFRKLINHVQLKEFTDELVNPDGIQAFAKGVSCFLAELVERVCLKTAFSEIGALALQTHIRQFEEYLSQIFSWPIVRATWIKLNQIVTILSVESIVDVYRLNFPEPKLTLEEFRQILNRRTDLRLNDLDWSRVTSTRIQ